MKQGLRGSVGSFDPSATDLGTFFSQHRTEFLTHARRLLGVSGDAEEVVQETLVRVLLASPELESWEHARSYFHKVIENLSIDTLRRRGVQPRLVLLDDAESELEAMWNTSEDLSDVLTRADDAAIIREAISLLSPAERAALVMWEIEGRSTSEIALELGLKESIVRHTVSRARNSLRRILSERILDEERGLTALDLLSTSYRRAGKLAQKSSRVALSFVIVVSAFLGLNSLASNDFGDSFQVLNGPEVMSNDRDKLQVEVQPKETNKSPSLSNDGFSSSEVTSRLSSSKEWNSTSSDVLFAGLDSQGLPTSFTVSDSEGNLGVLFAGQQKLASTETGLLLSNIVSTRSGAVNVLLDQSIVVDAFGTSYVAQVSVGIRGGWQLLNLSFVSSDVERLASGNYLLTAIMMVDSAVETAVKVSTSTSGTDLDTNPEYVATRVILDPAKAKILAQAVYVSADSQGNGA